MWEISNSSQVFNFGCSLVLGALFCLLYDIFRSIRFVFKISDLAIFFQDIIYFTLISFITFIFLLSLTNGEIRGYVIIGIGFGFSICYLTFSKVFLLAFKSILKFLNTLFERIKAVINKIIRKIYHLNIKIYKIIENSYKKGLKKVKRMLYTEN